MHMLYSNRSSSFYFIYFIALGVMGSSTLFAQQLDPYRWKNRVLLVFAPDPQDTRLNDQLSLLDAQRAGLDERNLKVLVLNPRGNATFNSMTTKDLYRKYKIENDLFVVLLIGKDGSEKLRKKQPVTPAELFRFIDAMPMRQSEMGRN